MKDRSTKKKKLGSYPYLSVIFTITLSLLMVGLFGLISIQAKRLSQLIQSNVEVQIFLNKGTTDSERTRIQKTILAKPYVNNSEELNALIFISKEEAAREFMESTGEDFSKLLGDNPLRDSFVAKVAPEYQSIDSIQVFKRDIEGIRGVFEVTYVESLVSSINKNLTKLGFILLGLSLIFILVVVVLINNTIKLALFSQRFLIRSMQLVGATSGFIKRPFLQRAFFYGVGAGVFASALLYLLLWFANNKIDDLSQLQRIEDILLLFGSLLVLGGTVAYVSTYRAVNKYLRTSLDELY